MKCIDEMIKKIQDNASRYDDDYMIAHLELAKKLCEISKDADTSSYVDKIAQTFCEILETQQAIIEDLKIEINSSNTRTGWRVMAPSGAQSNYIPSLQGGSIEKKEPEMFLEVPEGGEFKASIQVKEAFVGYLKKIRKNGKPLSETTVYDYSSRIKSLWVYFEKEWKSGILEGEVQICEERFRQGETYLNVYNNLELIEKFIEYKGNEIKEREAKGRPFSSEELAQSPLNSYKNVNNCSAALAKFRAFQEMVDEIVKDREDV
jgi:hypothetical protein